MSLFFTQHERACMGDIQIDRCPRCGILKHADYTCICH